MNDIKNKLVNKNILILASIILLFVLLRLPSLIEPDWYNDEGIYQVIGKALRDGRILYRDIWDHKPPVLYLIYAAVNSDLFFVKLASMLFGIGAIISLYKLALYLFKDSALAFVASTIFAILFGLPLLEGNVANGENFLVFPIILGIYTLLRYIENKKRSYLVLSGIIFSVALCIKIVAVFDIAAVLITFLLVNTARRESLHLPLLNNRLSLHTLKKKFSELMIFGGSMLTLPILFSIYFFAHRAFGDFIQSVLFNNVDYVDAQNSGVIFSGKLLALILITLGVIYFRTKLGFVTLFLCLWTIFSLFSVFFSQRPYTHYVLLFTPVVSLLLASLLNRDKTFFLRTLIIVVSFLLIDSLFNFNNRNLSYYTNYVQFLTNQKNLDEYYSYFDRKEPMQYAWAIFLKTHTKPDETIFVWSDRAQIYYLTDKLPPGRYTTDYHITSQPNAVEETIMALQIKQPKYIFDEKKFVIPTEFLTGYELKYTIGGAHIYERQL